MRLTTNADGYRGPELKRPGPDLYFEIDGHWSTGGHVLAADRVLAALEPFELEGW